MLFHFINNLIPMLMKKFTLLLLVTFVTAFALKAQDIGLVGLYTFSDSDDLFANYATEAGVGTIMCEGVFKFDPDADDTSADDMPSEEGTDWSVTQGVNDNAISLKAHNWFKVWHGIPANGGGDYVNDFTVVVDVRVAYDTAIYSLLEVNPTPHASGYTSEMEIVDLKVGSVGAPSSDYDPLGFSDLTLSLDTWHRLIYTAKLSEFIKIYLDGTLAVEMAGDFTDARPAPYGADTDPDDAAMKIGGNNETIENNDPPRDGDKDIDLIAIFNRDITADEAALLGAPGSFVGIMEPRASENSLKFYPNPARDVLHLSGSDIVQVDIINISGQLVQSMKMNGVETSIDISHLNSGIYMLKAVDISNRSTVQKLIVE